MAGFPNESEEEVAEVSPAICQISNRSGIKKSPRVKDRKSRAYLFGDLEDMCGDKNCSAMLHVSGKVLFHRLLGDRVKVDEWLVNKRERRLMDECLGKHQFLPCAA